MRRLFVLLILLGLAFVSPVEAATGRILKVLPFFLDKKGLHTLSPSLYERDSYQAKLRMEPELRSGVLYRVQWKTKGKAAAPLKVRLELRGVAQGNLPKQFVLEQPVTRKGWFSQWADLTLRGDDYKSFGEVVAWRVTLWEGEDLLLASEQSFLW